MKRKILFVAALAAPLAFMAPVASAQTADTWKWQASIYAYLPDISGRTTFPDGGGGGGSTLDAETILDNLKMTFMGSLEASNGRWGMFTDAVYMDIGNTKSGYRDFTLGAPRSPRGWMPTRATTSRAGRGRSRAPGGSLPIRPRRWMSLPGRAFST